MTEDGEQHGGLPSPDTKQLREQVAKQCEAVCRLATVLAEVHQDYALVMRDARAISASDALTDIVGQRTAYFMEALGDMLNGMDAADEEDRWLDPIFEEAQRLWPTSPAATPVRQDAGVVTDETDTTTPTPVVTDEPEG